MAVAIPTEMAFAETQRLLAACERLGIAAPILFLNLLTPASSCPTCAALSRDQQALRERYRQAYRARRVTEVFRQTEPRGVDRLDALGSALYGSSGLIQATAL